MTGDVQRWFVFSDVHLDGRTPHASFDAAMQVARDVRPYGTVWDGDVLELGALSRFPFEDEDAVTILPEVQQAAHAVNASLGWSERVVFVPGNHEARFLKAMFPGRGRAALAGMSYGLRDLWLRHGLDPAVEWVEESPACPGLWLGQGAALTLVRHGDLQAGGGKGAGNLSAKLARENPTVNVVHGHHHRAEVRFSTTLGVTRFHVANPCLAPLHAYYSGGDDRWERGFTELTFWDDGSRATAQVHVAHRGQIAYGGRVYAGRGRLTAPPREAEPRREAYVAAPAPAASPPAQPRVATCRNGHAKTDDNVYVDPYGSRLCRTCRAACRPAAKRRRTQQGQP